METNHQDKLEIARTAAKALCDKFSFPAHKMRQLDDSPLLDAVPLERDGRPVVAYRWFGGGRGDYYVQVEFYRDSDQVLVYGGYSHREFGPWPYDGTVGQP